MKMLKATTKSYNLYANDDISESDFDFDYSDCKTKETNFWSNIECFMCKLPFCLKGEKGCFLIIIRFL